MLRRLTNRCLLNLHRVWWCRGNEGKRGREGFIPLTVFSGRQFSVVSTYYSSSISGSSGGDVAYVPGYEKVRELQNADVNVQKILSLEYASQREHNRVATANMIHKLQGKEGDTGSIHVQIGTLTVRIQYLTEHMKKNRKDKSCLRSLIQLVHRRRMLLLLLKERDSQLYRTLLQDLGLREPTVHKYLQKRRKKK